MCKRVPVSNCNEQTMAGNPTATAGASNGQTFPQVDRDDALVNDILVVDDDALICGLVSEWLTQAGYAVRQAENGVEALAALHTVPASLVITDMHMPCADGVETLSVLRRDFPALAVIAMSGHFRSGAGYTTEMAARLGARKVLCKPFTRNDLLDAVHAALEPAR